ncbi:hypothetical protein Lser_V15G25302 [Lactuca serriola]
MAPAATPCLNHIHSLKLLITSIIFYEVAPTPDNSNKYMLKSCYWVACQPRSCPLRSYLSMEDSNVSVMLEEFLKLSQLNAFSATQLFGIRC